MEIFFKGFFSRNMNWSRGKKKPLILKESSNSQSKSLYSFSLKSEQRRRKNKEKGNPL